MSSAVTLSLEVPDDAVLAVLSDGLTAFNEAAVGPVLDEVSFVVTARDAAETVVGGVSCSTGRGVMYVRLIWVAERMQGLGSRLMDAAEARARDLGCAVAYLETLSFQARGFYEKRGYAVFGVLDYPDGKLQRIFLRKSLAPSSPEVVSA